MGNIFKPFSFYESVSSEILEKYHCQACIKSKEIYGDAKDISCDSITLDIMVGEEFMKFALGMCGNKVAMQSETGETIIVCDSIE